MKKANRLTKYFLYLFLIIIGIVIGIAIRHYNNITLEETINIVDVATLVVTVFLAVYIPDVLDRKMQVQRDKKDLIENRITEFQALQRRINLLVQDNDGMNAKTYLTIKNELDVSQNKLETIFTLIGYADLGITFEDEINEIKNLRKKHQDLLHIAEEKDTKYFYPVDIQQKEEKLYNEIDKATSLLLFKINDAE